MTKIVAYQYKYGLFWIGWVMQIKRNETTILYYDNDPRCVLVNEDKIIYVTIGIRKDAVCERIRKFCERRFIDE